MKVCKVCKEEKDISEFYNHRDSCKVCVRLYVSEYQKSNRANINLKRKGRGRNCASPEKAREYYLRNKEKYKLYPKEIKPFPANKLYKKYNVSEPFIRDMMDKQKGCCPICGIDLITPESKRSYCIDHDHNTGIVRGLLCNLCNIGIGFLKDNIRSLSNAIEYLKKR